MTQHDGEFVILKCKIQLQSSVWGDDVIGLWERCES